MTAILIPCKPLRAGKSRLSRVLREDERHALCRDLLAHTLDMARTLAAAAQIRIVTEDAEARGLAATRGIAALGDPGVGLNAALTQARKSCGAAPLLVLPIDLPLATADDLRAVLDTTADVAIAPDAADAGTNALLLRSAAARTLPFAFGPDSLRRHRHAARRLGQSVDLVRRPGLAMDIDTPQDHAAWRDGYALGFAPLGAATT